MCFSPSWPPRPGRPTSPPSALPRSPARSAGTPTMTCRVDSGARSVANAGRRPPRHRSGQARPSASDRPTAPTLGATQMSTTEPWRTVAGRSSTATLTGTSTRSASVSSAMADRGSSSPAATGRLRVASGREVVGGREVAVRRRRVGEADLAALQITVSHGRSLGQVARQHPHPRPCRRPRPSVGHRPRLKSRPARDRGGVAGMPDRVGGCVAPVAWRCRVGGPSVSSRVSLRRSRPQATRVQIVATGGLVTE